MSILANIMSILNLQEKEKANAKELPAGFSQHPMGVRLHLDDITPSLVLIRQMMRRLG